MPGITPPRNVIYYNSDANQIPLAGISDLPYTDVILAFLVPTDPANGNYALVGQGGAFDSNLQSNIQALQSAGKNVLISLGGQIISTPTPGQAGFTSAAWKYYAENFGDGDLLRDILNNWVNPYGFNGVDIDYEDDNGFTKGPGTYDGITFLKSLTNELALGLSEGPARPGIITHAPAPNYFDPNGGYYDAYTQIWQGNSNVTGSGINISWINCQFYNNGTYDMTADEKITWYNNIANITGPPKLVLGAPITPDDTTDPCNPDGYLPLDQFISQVIMPLRVQFGQEFGGVMGWEFAHDLDGGWADGIWQALA